MCSLSTSTDLRALSAINTSFEAPPFPSPSLAQSSSPSCASPSSSHPTQSQLRYLDLGRCALPPGSVPAQAFPNLRAVALWLTSEEVEASTEPITQLFRQIGEHLLALTISGSLHDVLSPSLRRMSSLKLVDVWDFSSLDVLDALEHPLQLLHINMTARRSSTHPDRTPLAITTLQQRLSHPRTEVALSSLQEVRISFEKPPTTAPSFFELAEACKLRNVRLCYDLRPALGVHFSTEYWRAVRENEEGWEWGAVP